MILWMTKYIIIPLGSQSVLCATHLSDIHHPLIARGSVWGLSRPHYKCKKGQSRIHYIIHVKTTNMTLWGKQAKRLSDNITISIRWLYIDEETFTQRCFAVGPTSPTLAQRRTSAEPTPNFYGLVCLHNVDRWWCNIIYILIRAVQGDVKASVMQCILYCIHLKCVFLHRRGLLCDKRFRIHSPRCVAVRNRYKV